MKVKILRVFSLFFAAILLPAVFSCSDLSVSKQGGSLSFSIDSRDLLSQLDSHSSWSSVKLELALFGDYTAERAVSCSENDLKKAEFPVKTVTFDGIPFDSSVYVKALLYGTYVEDGSEFISIGYYGESDPSKPAFISEENPEGTIEVKLSPVYAEDGSEDEGEASAFGTSSDSEIPGFFVLEALESNYYTIGYSSLSKLDGYSTVSFGKYNISKGSRENPLELEVTELLYSEKGRKDLKFVRQPKKQVLPINDGKFSISGTSGVKIDFDMSKENSEDVSVKLTISDFPADNCLSGDLAQLSLFMVSEESPASSLIKEFMQASESELSDDTALKIFDLEDYEKAGEIESLGSWGCGNDSLEISGLSASITTKLDSPIQKGLLFATAFLDDGSYYLALPAQAAEFKPGENNLGLVLKKWKIPYKLTVFLMKDDASDWNESNAYSKKVALENLALEEDTIGSEFNSLEGELLEAGYRYNPEKSGEKSFEKTFSISYYFDLNAPTGSVDVDKVKVSAIPVDSPDAGSDDTISIKTGKSGQLVLSAANGEGAPLPPDSWEAVLSNANGRDEASSDSRGEYLSVNGPNLLIEGLPEGLYFLDIIAYVEGNSYSVRYTLEVVSN